MEILLIGGTGVLSSAVVQEALTRGISVTLINRGHRHSPDGVSLIVSDKDDYERISAALDCRKFDAVVDFLCMTDKDVANSFNLYSKYCNQYVLISSCAVYNKDKPSIKDENAPKVDSRWSYSVNKWAAECRLKELSKDSSCATTVIRPSITYGDTRIPYGVSPRYGCHWTMIARALAGKPILRWNRGENFSNMLRVEDFAVGLVDLLGNPAAFGEAFNICGDERPTYNDVLRAIENAIGHEVPVFDITPEFYAEELPERAGEILVGRAMDSWNSNEKIKRVSSRFHQTIFLEEGVFKTVEAYRKNKFQSGIDWYFDATTDRIIRRWCREHRDVCCPNQLKFRDYLGNASKHDWVTYHLIRGKGTFEEKFLRRCLSLRNKINSFIGRFWNA